MSIEISYEKKLSLNKTLHIKCKQIMTINLTFNMSNNYFSKKKIFFDWF